MPKKRDLLTLFDLSPEEIERLLVRAAQLKAQRSVRYEPLRGKTLGLVFYKASTRTRVSFEVAASQLGGYSLFLGAGELQLGRGESVQDTARVLSRYLDGLALRTFSHEEQEEWARYATIPVINALSDLFHPCQILADILTIQEHRGSFQGAKVAYVGDGNNVAHSWLAAASTLGIHLSIASPRGYQPHPEIVQRARKSASRRGAQIEILEDPYLAVRGAHFLYTDVWASMGQEAEQAQRRQAFQGYQLNRQLLAAAHEDARVMHCLPAHRGEEITDEVLEGERSLIFDEAENRLHIQKAILEWLIIEGS